MVEFNFYGRFNNKTPFVTEIRGGVGQRVVIIALGIVTDGIKIVVPVKIVGAQFDRKSYADAGCIQEIGWLDKNLMVIGIDIPA